MCAKGCRIPAMITPVFTNYIPFVSAPILDAGCVGGLEIAYRSLTRDNPDEQEASAPKIGVA